MKRVGVLALQGDFAAHQRALGSLGAEAIEVRTSADLDGLQGIILPGGESTTMLKLMKETGMMAPFQAFAGRNPVFGTCAGAILMARTVVNPIQEALGLMNLDVERNGYGRQVDSSIARIAFGGEDFEAIFIRAPIILRAGSGATVLAEHNGQPVLVEEGQHLVATFHPELTADTRIHAYFLSKIEA